MLPSRLLKKAHLLRFPHLSSLRRTAKYASLLVISGALHLGIFEQPGKNHFLSKLLKKERLVNILSPPMGIFLPHQRPLHSHDKTLLIKVEKPRAARVHLNPFLFG